MALSEHIPNVRLYVTGLSQYIDWATTEEFTPRDVDALATKLPNIVNCFDIGMWHQIALMEYCDIFCSPHTGFAFLSQMVYTPWLIISGCPWPEYLFNGVPFYSVLPDCPWYPAQERTDTECCRRWLEGRQVVCMEDANIERRIPDIVKGAQLLLDPAFTYEQAGYLHIDKLKALDRDPKRFGCFDWTS